MIKKLGLLVLGFSVILTLGACTDQTTEIKASEFYVAVDINPSIEFIVDEDDDVTSFNLVNEDALILCADVEFTGMNIEDAVELFITLATEAGFIDIEADDNSVLFTVLGGNKEINAEQLQERIRIRALRYFTRNFIKAEIFTEDFTQVDLLLQAEELGITPGKLKLILLAQSYDETLTIELGIETPIKDLISLVKSAQKEIMKNLTEEQKQDLIEQKQALMIRYSHKLKTHLKEKTPLTDEEIDSMVNKVKNVIKTTSKKEWKEASEAWRNIMKEKHQNTDKTNDDQTD